MIKLHKPSHQGGGNDETEDDMTTMRTTASEIFDEDMQQWPQSRDCSLVKLHLGRNRHNSR